MEWLAPLTWAELLKEPASGSSVPYVVRITVKSLNVRKGPGTNYAVVKTLTNDTNAYTITEESSGSGATLWGPVKVRNWMDFSRLYQKSLNRLNFCLGGIFMTEAIKEILTALIFAGVCAIGAYVLKIRKQQILATITDLIQKAESAITGSGMGAEKESQGYCPTRSNGYQSQYLA